MREYEKWRAKERKHLISISTDCSRSDSGAAWRAVLEWMLENIDYSDSPKSLRAKIKDELED